MSGGMTWFFKRIGFPVSPIVCVALIEYAETLLPSREGLTGLPHEAMFIADAVEQGKEIRKNIIPMQQHWMVDALLQKMKSSNVSNAISNYLRIGISHHRLQTVHTYRTF